MGDPLTIDTVFRANAARTPEAIALVDPPNRESVDGKEPHRFSYAQADRVVGAMVERLRGIGLPPAAVIGVQMPNTIESILTLLAVMRASMIPALLPLLWRRADCVAALSRAGAKAVFTCGRVGDTDHAKLALDIAAELFPIRIVCGFGCGRAEGIVPFDDLLSIEKDACADRGASSDEAACAALITFDNRHDGPVPVARTHGQLLAGGSLLRHRAAIVDGAAILTTISAASFAGLSVGFLPWLVSGGALALHQPFAPDILSTQIESHRCSVIAVPAAILPGLCDTEILNASAGRSTILALWRAPERLAAAPPWQPNHQTALVDVAAFGEAGLLAAARPADGRPVTWTVGPVTIKDGERKLELARIVQTPAGTLGLGGALAASQFDDPDLKPGQSRDDNGIVDTGYACRALPGGGLVVTAAPSGLINVGGYRFAIHDLQRIAEATDRDGVLAALPHLLSGYRLAGHAADPAAMRQRLQARGLNPLVCEAFRNRYSSY